MVNKINKGVNSEAPPPARLGPRAYTTEMMSSASTYVKGLLYEVLTVEVLRRHSFVIQHCGKSGDRGIDFRGQWILPDNKLSVIGKQVHVFILCIAQSFVSVFLIHLKFSHAIE